MGLQEYVKEEPPSDANGITFSVSTKDLSFGTPRIVVTSVTLEASEVCTEQEQNPSHRRNVPQHRT